MDKLTQEQIAAIDKALWDIEIRFLDIRIEMTDHAATAIEATEGSFKQNLEQYIFENKRELKKNYRKLRRNASLKAVKLLFSNMFSFRFLVILATVYTLVFAEYKYEGLEETSNMFMMVSIFGILGGFICNGYIKFVRSYKLFSTAERLTAIVGSLGVVLCIWLPETMEKQAVNDMVLLLYYSFVLSFYIMVVLTYRSINSSYKSRYQVI